METAQVREVKEVKVYYMQHYDGLSRLHPVILLDGGRVWNGALKKKVNGVDMYYLFYHPNAYMKIWRDSRGNLLYHVDRYDGTYFSNDEPRVWLMDSALRDMNWSDDTLTYGQYTIKFTVPLFRIARELHTWLASPLAYILFKLFGPHVQAPQDSAQDPSDHAPQD